MSKRSLALVSLAILAVAVATFGLWRWQDYDPDRSHVIAQRAQRLAMAKRGEALPGTPDLSDLNGRLAAHGLTLGAPVFIRIFKREFELEVWVKRDERFHRFAVYPICRWSGDLGPKLIEGDAQAPEGFYTVDKRALNPASRWHKAFNLGFPNAYDRSHAYTGSFLMVHGGCSSVGCYAMTNAVVDELWRLVETALKRGQPRVHVHVFPFRLEADALAARSKSPWSGFWSELKYGYDAFEATQLPPRVAACDGKYVVSPAADYATGTAAIADECGGNRGAARASGRRS